MGKPLKRHPALVPLSQDHHFGLLLVWKIRQGLKQDLNPIRIVEYLDYFFNTHLNHHFLMEEELIFTYLAKNDLMRKEAEQQHEDLRTQVKYILDAPGKLKDALAQFADALEAHIRFEERKLFQHIQEEVVEKDLEELGKRISGVHEKVEEEWQDQFWFTKK